MERRTQKQRWYLLGLSLLLVVLMATVFWQTSLTFGEFRPTDVEQTLVLWAISTVVFLGMVTLGFILFRNLVKLYLERQVNRVGAKIKTRLVAGALALTILPTVFLFFFAFSVLNRTLDKWFSQPMEQVQKVSLAISNQLKDAARDKVETLAEWVASLPEVTTAAARAANTPSLQAALERFAQEQQLEYIAVGAEGARTPWAEYAASRPLAGLWATTLELRPTGREGGSVFLDRLADAPMALAARPAGHGTWVIAGWQMPANLTAQRQAMDAQYHSYQEQTRYWRFMRYFYVGMLSLITLFILFVATWVALFLSKQIVLPIEKLVQATGQVSSGHLDYRVETQAIDELGLLVRSFNDMTAQLERSREELEARRQFTEAILEAIPTGVISLSPQGEIRRVNPSLGRIFPPERVGPARWLDDLFTMREDLARVKRLVRRAQRTGLATASLDLTLGGQVRHLALTVAALEPEDPSPGAARGCILVLEDTSELLRAQKSAAWQEVARRVAHEIKNPLTPIALSAERISRLVERYRPEQDVRARLELDRLLHSCTGTIVREIETLKTLVDEFSQFARFPAARPEPGDLNEVVEAALESCDGRTGVVRVERRLAADLPLIAVDGEQFRRAVVNLLENALEAMGGTEQQGVEPVLTITTALGAAGDSVELIVADSGHGIALEDREKLFLPYFSTRKRGTGLGLAIVSRIVAEHNGAIRVEDNQPRGTRFIVEMPTVEARVTAEVHG